MMETYYGVVRSPADAIKLFEATRLGLLPRVQRRLSEKERQAIRSGSVFVWDEREAGMRRWTDGKSWSASRVSGSFLTYREMEGKRGNAFGGSRRGAGKTPDSGRGSDEDQDDGEPDGYRYKPDGLTKQSFSITNSAGQHLHLIAYYSRGPLDLLQPSNDPALRHIVPAKGMYPESSLAETQSPAASRAPMHQQHYPSHHHQPPPHHGYPPQYPHPGYAWPPSPVGTPPYNHGHYAYSQGPPPPPPGPHAYPPHAHHPQHPQHSQHPHHPYPPGGPNSIYERSPLPPPHHHQHPHQHPQSHPGQHPHQHQQPHQQPHQQSHPPPQLPAPLPPKTGMPLPQPYPQTQRHSPQIPPPRLSQLDSPRSQHLQAQAREAVQIEPRLAPIDAARNQHSPLSASSQLAQQHPNGTAAAAAAAAVPPTSVATSPSVRAPSASPPRSAVSNESLSHTPTASTRPTLSALLLHPPAPPAGSEPNSANPVSAGAGAGGGVNSAGSSPSGGGPTPNGISSSSSTSAAAARGDLRTGGEDARAIGVLNKNFF